jgi:hypothetical protein
MQLRFSRFWDITHSILVVVYRRFGRACSSHFKGSSLILEDRTDRLTSSKCCITSQKNEDVIISPLQRKHKIHLREMSLEPVLNKRMFYRFALSLCFLLPRVPGCIHAWNKEHLHSSVGRQPHDFNWSLQRIRGGATAAFPTCILKAEFHFLSASWTLEVTARNSFTPLRTVWLSLRRFS